MSGKLMWNGSFLDDDKSMTCYWFLYSFCKTHLQIPRSSGIWIHSIRGNSSEGNVPSLSASPHTIKKKKKRFSSYWASASNTWSMLYADYISIHKSPTRWRLCSHETGNWGLERSSLGTCNKEPSATFTPHATNQSPSTHSPHPNQQATQSNSNTPLQGPAPALPKAHTAGRASSHASEW